MASTVPRVVFAGTPAFALPCLHALMAAAQAGLLELAAVYTQPDRRRGRGQQWQSSAVKQFALQHQLRVHQPPTLSGTEVDALRGLGADLLVVVAYGQLLPQVVLDLPRLGCVNLHASLLPRWRGAAPLQRALQAGDASTGVTLMQMQLAVDSGPILAQRRIDIAPEDTAGSLHDKLAALGGRLLSEQLGPLLRGELSPQVQDAAQATYAPKVSTAESRIDWHESAAAISRSIRAFEPWPGKYTYLGGMRLRILSAAALAEPNDAGASARAIGEVVKVERAGLDVVCGQGLLRIQRLQKSGGRAVAAADFINGHSISAGARLH